MEGYVVDILPGAGSATLVLNGFKTVEVKTTFPIYIETRDPDRVAQHPDVVYYEGEQWRYLDGREVTLYRFELRDLRAYYHLSKRYRVLNELPTVLSQTLFRLGALPFRKVSIRRGEVEIVKDELDLSELSIASVVTEDWFGPSPTGHKFRANLNGREMTGDLDDLSLRADVAECMGRACHKIRASVKLNMEEKRAPVSVKGLIEWSYVSRTPVRELMRATIGKALTTNEAWVAFKRRVIIPDVVPRVEKERNLEQLRSVDKGGLVLFPKLGCFNDVVQVDFSSLYPSIIIKYNISAETVDACHDVVTEIGHDLCYKEKGIVPEALEWLVNRKEYLKSVDPERAEAVKWILVASFGYLGYRNSKFGKIEAYELVTHFARKTLRNALEIASERGLEVIHGIVDSLMVKGRDVDDFVREVQERTGFKLKAEPMSWVVLTSRRDGNPYPMRYFGRTSDGVKMKGVIRDNMPNLVKDFLEDLRKLMSSASDCEELMTLRAEVMRLLRGYLERVVSGEPRDYVMWVKGIPYVRGVRGFYDARNGFLGRDLEYYRQYLSRTVRVVYPWL
jgi:DNA polymerase I